MRAEIDGIVFVVLAAILATVIPLLITGTRKRRHKDRLIDLVVLGSNDPLNPMPSLVERDKALRDLIAQRTVPIQPGANGGDSLADLHRAVGRIDEAVDRAEKGTYANSRALTDLAEKVQEHIDEAHDIVAKANTERIARGEDPL